MTIFERIIQREIPASIVYEDDLCIAFHDINPLAPVHILLVPKKPVPCIDALEEEDKVLIGHLFLVISKIAAQNKLENGYRVIANNGPDACQTVDHLHFHILGGKQLPDKLS
ncbi:MAG: histidine triad nucleotide-binding protein [Planctomycetia bacterium]|nr:histidine triad nucleotide-binding protein [Planctomycetia bacterium]